MVRYSSFCQTSQAGEPSPRPSIHVRRRLTYPVASRASKVSLSGHHDEAEADELPVGRAVLQSCAIQSQEIPQGAQDYVHQRTCKPSTPFRRPVGLITSYRAQLGSDELPTVQISAPVCNYLAAKACSGPVPQGTHEQQAMGFAECSMYLEASSETFSATVVAAPEWRGQATTCMQHSACTT